MKRKEKAERKVGRVACDKHRETRDRRLIRSKWEAEEHFSWFNILAWREPDKKRTSFQPAGHMTTHAKHTDAELVLPGDHLQVDRLHHIHEAKIATLVAYGRGGRSSGVTPRAFPW
ncbi:uncharacterized [Tachysurus ichikawai]